MSLALLITYTWLFMSIIEAARCHPIFLYIYCFEIINVFGYIINRLEKVSAFIILNKGRFELCPGDAMAMPPCSFQN